MSRHAGPDLPGAHATQRFSHEPVMLAEVLELVAVVPDGLVLDATVGGGGHAAAILAGRAGVVLLGLDRDRRAVEEASRRLSVFGGRARVEHARFDHLDELLDGARAG
ncbi:MAG TPA: 16S rRNA (cytosine(1402)-N(4))-methyltransferase, partial [Acidimicrobiales bacterium]|nr:16S rRNA (cytosine(1402)-N(4))-methyltransferase [Acidimicrobiales bacterium]